MLARLFRTIISILLGAIYAVLLLLSCLAAGLVVISWFAGSTAAVAVFGYALAVFLFSFVACFQKSFRTRVRDSKTGRFPMFVAGLVVGTVVGMVFASAWLGLDEPDLAMPSMLLLSIGLPVSVFVLDYLGIDFGMLGD